MASPAAVLQILVTANTAQATTSLAKTQGQLKATAATAATASNTMGSRLATGAKYGALAMAGLGAASVKMAVDFDKSMRNVNSIAQLNEKQFAKLEDRVKSLAGRTAQSPKTLAEGLYDLVSSGFDANESMKVLASSAKAATAGLTDTATSTKAVAAVLNAYRMPAKKAADVSDTLFQTVNIGVVSFDELASTIGDVLPFASSLGVKLNEVGAATATMTKAGISPAETMTRLKAIMSSLLKPSEALSGALKQMGYESGEALIEQKGLQGALDALSKTTGGSKQAMAALFPNIRALGGALALTGENSKVANKDLAAFADTSGATSKALAEQSKSVAFQWNKLKAQGHALAIDVGDNLIPALRDMLEILTNPKLTLSEKVAKLGSKLTKTIEEWGPKVAKAGAAVGLAIVKGIWGAFWDSDLLGKLFIGAAALRLFGGPGVFRALGAKMGRSLGIGMAPTMASSTIAASTTGAAASKWKAFGTRIGKWIGPAASAALVLDIVWPDIDNQGGGLKGFINNIGRTAFTPFSPFPDKVDVSSREEFAHMLEEEFGKAAGSVKFQGKDRLRVATELGTLIFSAQTQKVVATNTKRLKDLLGKSMGQADRAIEVRSNTQERAAQEFDRLTGRYKHLYGSIAVAAVNMSDKQDKAYREAAKAAVQSGAITRKQYDRLIDKLDNAGDATKQMWRQAADVTGEKTKQIKANVGDMTVKVSKSYDNMVRVTGSGIDWLMKNTGDAMKALGLKQELKWNLQRHKTGPTGGGYGNQSRMHGGLVGFDKGAIVGGTGSGDKVPLHIGGRLSAMVEPGELVSVTNRTATAAQMALNRKIPRRARGGTVPGATGGLHPSILGLVNSLYSRFGGSVTSGLRAGDSSSLHSTGQAADYVPSNWPAAAAAVNRVGSSLLEGIYNPSAFGGPAVSWDSGGRVPSSFWGSSTWAAHANHIHLAIADGTKAVAGAAVEQIKRVLLKGPKGPLRDMGQAALDKVHSAANAYLKKVMPRVGVEAVGPGANVKNLPSALQKYNHIYAEHNSAEGDWGGYRMPFNAVAALAEWAGAPGVSMARTAIGESNLRPGATGVDRGGTKGYGLWMITTSFNDDLVKPYGGYGQMLNPVLNAQVMSKILDRQGYGAWYSDTLDTSGTHYNGPLLRKYGGLVPHLAKGGKAGDKPLHGTATPGPVTNAFKRFRKARRIAKQLKDLLGERGRVARVDERIANAEALAGLASSEAGSEMSPKELARQIRLNELLLANLVKARKLARSGLGLTRWPKGMSVDKRTEGLMKGLAGGFQSNLVDLTGLTGSGGRIFETKNIIDELKHTTGAGPAALDISGLRSVIEAARYGVFDGYFARGGNLKPGRWGIAGERGPEVVHGPSTVLSPRATQDVLAPKVEVHNEFDFDGLDLYVTTKVNGEIAKRERVNHRRGRQAVR